jgi:pimeloyl-ACP methyl ester carboxylesterase
MGNTLSGFDRPLLMVRGGRSKVLTRSTAEAFAATFPKGHFIEICDAGHNVQEDQPLALIEALCRFWTEADLHRDRTKFLDARNVGSS